MNCRLVIEILITLLAAIGLAQCWQPCQRASRISSNHQYRGELHLICLQNVPNSRPRLEVFQYASRRLIWSHDVDDFGTNQLASFVDTEGNLRMLLAVPTKINGTSMYSIDASGNYIRETHTVNTQFVSTLAIWRLDLNWEWHLAIANQPFYDHLVAADSYGANKRQPLPKPGPFISIHSWRSTYFDKYQTIQLPYDARVNKLEPMHINDQEFLIIAMESSAGGPQASLDSLIYKLDFGDGTLEWRHYQNLETKLAIDASSFLVTHKGSLQTDYYIAIVGQRRRDGGQNDLLIQNLNRDENNRQSDEHGLIIYKYFGDQFVETHSIPVPGATKLDTISYGQGDSYVVVAMLSGWSQQISLFLFDGLNLKSLPSPQTGHGVVPRPMPRGPLDLKYRRSMDSNSLHLFQVPTPQNNDTLMKRTLDGLNQILGLPALAFSSVGDGDFDNDLSNSTVQEGSQETFYQIPVHEHLEPDHDASHTKRNFVNQFGSDHGSIKELLGWCRAQINNILGDNFEHASHQLASLPKVNQARPIHIMGDLVIEGNLHVSNLLYANQITNGRTPIGPPTPLNTTQTFDRIERTHAEIDSLKTRVDQILVDDGTIQEVNTPLRFQRLVFECLNPVNTNPRLQPTVGVSSCPQVGELRTHLLNGRNVSDIKRQALLTGRSMTVGQEVRFEHLVLRGQTKILSTLNRIGIEEIIFGRSRKPIGTIYGHKDFMHGLYSTANINVENWNGARVDRFTTLTSTGEQRIEANLKFSQILLDSMSLAANSGSSRIEFLNGLHLDAHLNQIAQVDDDNKFELPIAFDELVINGPLYFSPGSLLSHVNLEDLWSSVLFGHSHQNITAPMEFLNVHVSYGGDIHVAGPVNGVHLVPDNVMMRNRNYDLPNPFVFEGDLSVRLLQLEKALNGIQVIINPETQQKELAILYDGGNQLLSGIKIFNEVQLGGYNNIGGLINGHLNLTQLSQLARNDGEPFRFATVRISPKLIRVANNAQVHVEALINGIHANEICAFANSLAQSPANQQHRQYNRLKFGQQPIVFKQLRCASINGFSDLKRSFLMKHADQRVAGTLRLVNGVVFNSTVNIGATFNNLNIRPLARAITQVLNESRTGHKDFYGDLFIDDLFANSINDLQLASVFVAKSDHPQIISAPMSFDHLDIENVLIVGRELMSHSFNGLNVSDIITNTLQYDAPQVIYNHVELDHLHILPGSNLITSSLNGHDIRQLYSDAVLVDVGQQILAPKIFKNRADLTNRASLRFGIDGLSENELRFNLLLQSDELIEDDLEFNNDVTVKKSLEIQTGQINDIDVNLFVNSMLYENRPNGLRVLGNSSLRFKDVRLNDLVVTGTIQGYDLSRDAIQKSDNVNGTYDAIIRQEQIMRNNQQMFNRLYNSGSTFGVQTRNRNETFLGSCHIHSCPQTTPFITLAPGPISSAMTSQTPRPTPQQHNSGGQLMRPVPPPFSPAPWTMGALPQPPPTRLLPPPRPVATVHNVPFVPMMPRPQPLVNTSMIPQVWRPLVQTQTPVRVNDTHFIYDQQFPLVDPRYLNYQADLKARAIHDLAFRVNRFLSVSFYYEIVQKHPFLGTVLHAGENPTPTPNPKGAWLLLRAATGRGEPCLQRGQKIAVMDQRNKNSSMFTQLSTIQETTNPRFVDSVKVGTNHYLFVIELQPDTNRDAMSHMLVYLWNLTSGMYDMLEKIAIDGFPSAMKAFVVNNQVACVALANPRVVQGGSSGAPLLYCQQAPMSNFNQRTVLGMTNIFDLDIVPLASSNGLHFLIAALSQQDTEQVGDLIVSRFDYQRHQLHNLVKRRTAKPLKLHFVKQISTNTNLAYNLVVSEGITSNDAAQATTRIFSINAFGPRFITETQVIRENQFVDIQSVLLDERHSMIFMRSTHSISIFAQMPPVMDSAYPPCASYQFQLVQRLPTKGANKFLVFNSQNNHDSEVVSSKTRVPFNHLLVLSRDDCARQQYSTVILKPKFR